MDADLDTLLTARYVELVDRIIPAQPTARRRPGRPPAVTDAELVCLAVAQVLLRYNEEHHRLRAAPTEWDTCSLDCSATASTTPGSHRPHP